MRRYTMSTVVCPSCKEKNNIKAEKCKKCGFEIQKFIIENHFDDTKHINICPKCAKVTCPSIFEPIDTVCSFCGTKLIHDNSVSVKDWKRIVFKDYQWHTELVHLTEDLGITNYSKEAYNERTKEDRIHYYKTEQPVPQPTQKPTISCPYCKSTNVGRISTARRMASTAMVGLASKKIGKQWHCNNCKSDF